MKFKKIAALPVPKCNQNGEVVVGSVLDDTLILDCFKDKEHIGKYCVDKNKKYQFWDGEFWRQLKFRSVFGYAWWWWGSPEKVKVKNDTVVFDFLSQIESYGMTISSKLEYIESDFMHEKRKRAIQNKQNRIDALMAEVPTIPDDFETWVYAVPFKNLDYMFYDKTKGVYHCTACGKTHSNKKAKHNEWVTCSRTQKRVQIKRRVDKVKANDKCMLIQVVNDSFSVARHFTLYALWKGSKKSLAVYEEVRIMLPRNLTAARHKDVYYGQRYTADEHEQEWWDGNPVNKKPAGRYCYPIGVNDALQNTVYANCGVQYLAETGVAVNYNGIMCCWNYGSPWEYLVKCGFTKILEEESNCTGPWGYYGSLNPSGTNDVEVFGIDKQRINRLRQNNGGTLYLEWMREEYKNNVRIPEEAVQWLVNKKITPGNLEFISDKLSVHKIVNYLRRQQELCYETPMQLLTTWRDYLSMAERLKMNTCEEMIYKPKNLYSAHQTLVDRINKGQDAKEARDIAKKFPNCNKVIKTLSLYEWGDEEYTVVAPKGIVDIISEGRALNHCVGTTERYYDRIATQESYILFLRHSDNPDKPYYTLEVEPGGTIRQKRTTGDKQTKDIDNAKAFLTRWQKVIAERITEKEKELAKKSKNLRLAEFKELRKNGNRIYNGALAGQLLVDVLEKDLMEIESA